MPWEGEGGGGGVTRRLAGFLARVRRMKIEAGRYKAGWMRLSTGRRKRGSGVAGDGDGDGRGPEDRSADDPPSRFGGGGGSPPARR